MPTMANGKDVCEDAYQKVNPSVVPDRLAAIGYLQGFQSKCETNLTFQSRLVADYLVLKRYEDAERLIQAGLKIDPAHRALLLDLGEIRLTQKAVDEAASIARRLISSHSKFFGGYSLMQRTLMEQRRFEESVEYGRKAVQYESYPVLWLNLAVAQYHSKQFGACVDSANRAIQLDPAVLRRSWGINEAIYSLDALGKQAEALALAKRRKQADPNWNQDRALVRALDLLATQ